MTAEQSHCTPGVLLARGLIAVALALVLWFIVDVLLLVLAAILLAMLVRIPADWLVRTTGMRDSFAIAIALTCLITLLGLLGWLFGSAVSSQVQQLTEQLPKALDALRKQLPQWGWIPEHLTNPASLLQGSEGRWLGRGLSAITATFGAIANLVIVLLMAFFFSVQPDLYVNGFVRLIPVAKRERAREILDALNRTLRHWLGGQLVLMVLVGVLTILGLSLIGVSYALSLGLLAGLLTFIPFLGPILSAFPAVLVAVAQSPTTALLVAGLYVAVQAIENALEPVVQQRAIYLPPVLLLFGQITLGLLIGILGIVLATPLTAVLMVLTQMIYVQDVLEGGSARP